MRSAALLVVALAGPLPAAAQRVTATEVSIVALATVARWDFFGGGVSLAYRPGLQGRVSVLAAGGTLDGRAGLRAEATAQFLLNPVAQTGATVYGGAGASYRGAQDVRGSGYVTVLLGVEQGAARRRGWFVEAGFGGGARLAAGLRWRRFSRR